MTSGPRPTHMHHRIARAARLIPTDVAGGDDAASWPRWVAGGLLVLVALGGVVLAVQRRGNS